MGIKIALAGNPNSGKTTMFNDLTGSNQYVGNWPGVTVEKKEGVLRSNSDVVIQDLPGIYSLSPYTPEEIVTRNYLINEKPDAIIDIIDGTNIERNLYLTTQLLEIGIPVVVAINMIDIVRKNGDEIDLERLGKHLHCVVMETSALKSEGSQKVAEKAIELVKSKEKNSLPHVYDGCVEHALAHIEECIEEIVPKDTVRWYAIKIFERDINVLKEINLSDETRAHIEEHIRECEAELDDDAESIIINERYNFIERQVAKCVTHKKLAGNRTSDKIDNILTNRYLALPIFVAIIFLIYYISVSTLGTFLTDFIKETIVEDWIMGGLSTYFASKAVAPWLSSLIVDGVIAGVGSVISFVPQILLVSFFLSILEDIGYMSRIAFMMDKLFRKFGLSGKSFIPLLVGSGCSVPGIMASRTIENESDRRMTIITTSFIPCSAKLPIITLIAAALFGGKWWVAPLAYFIGIAAVIVSGVLLKKTKAFRSNPAPFVMELPPYHMPAMNNILKTTWDRGWSFVKRAGTVILLSSVVLWFLQSYGIVAGQFTSVTDNNTSFLANIGKFIAPIFIPIGFGNWQSSVSIITGLIAKENIVGTLGVLFNFSSSTAAGLPYWTNLSMAFTPLGAFSFLVFNLLCAPCFAAMGTIKKEMNSAKWTIFAIAYQCIFAYIVSLIIYQFGLLFTTGMFTVHTVFAILVLIGLIYGVARKVKEPKAA